MSYTLAEIKIMRSRLGLSQSELAQHAGVSQSLIAKVESGRIDPAYSKAVAIFSALEALSKHHGLKAKDVMQKGMIGIAPNEGIKDAIGKMRKHQISQLPVLEDGRAIGLVSESSILESLTGKGARVVQDVMVEAPPVVSKDASMDVISGMLRFYPLIVVSEGGKPVGVITKSDIIARM